MNAFNLKRISILIVLLSSCLALHAKPYRGTQPNSLYARSVDSLFSGVEVIEINYNELAKLYPPKPPKDLAVACRRFNVKYQLTDDFELLTSDDIYPLNTRECHLSDCVGMLDARLRHKSGLWEVYPNLDFILGDGPVRGSTKESIMHGLAIRMAKTFNFGKRYTATNLQERRDLLELLREYPKRLAKQLFNAEELYSFPLNFGREKIGDKGFYCGRAYYVLKGGYWFGLYVLSAEEAPVDFDAFLPKLKGLFTFE